MTFRIMAYVTAFAGLLLGLRFLFASASILRQWGLEPTDAPILIGRRIGALYLGFAVIFFLGSAAAPSELRSAVCLGMTVASAALAGLGFFERRAARVSSGILVPAIIEAALAAGFAWAWWEGRSG